MAADSIDTYTHPSSYVYHLLNHTYGAPWFPIRTQKQYTLNTAAFSLAWLLIVNVTLPRPQFLPAHTLPLNSISPILRDPESRIWSPQGPQQSPETTLNTYNTAPFSGAQFWMVEIMLQQPIYLHPALIRSPSCLSQGTLIHKYGALGAPIQEQKQSKIAPMLPQFATWFQTVLSMMPWPQLVLTHTSSLKSILSILRDP